MRYIFLLLVLIYGMTLPAIAQVSNPSRPPSIATASAAGTNQGTAAVVTTGVVVVTTVSPGTGVILNGTSQTILNMGANTLLVYPVSGAQIGSLGTNAAFSIASGSQAAFYFTSATQAYPVFSSFQ